MSVHVIRMPDLGEGIAEVELVAWHVAPGDVVAEDQVLADVMTDKASVEIPSPVVGTVLALGGEVGQMMAVGSELIRIDLSDAATGAHDVASMPALPVAPPRPAASSPPATAMPPPASAQPAAPSPSSSPSLSSAERPLASPAVRARAWELGIDLRDLKPSGTAGRVMQADLDAHLARAGARTPTSSVAAPAAAAPRPASSSAEPQMVKIVGLRRKIALKMQEAKRRIPHFTYVEEVDVTELVALRAQLNARFGEQRGHLTLLAFLVRAIVLGARDFPQVNARFDDEAGVLALHPAVHLGIATQTPAGLLVPVLRDAQTHDLWANAAEVARLAAAARSGKAVRDELSGSTITLTSLGRLGGIVSTPIINHPEVAIVGVNRIVSRPVVRDGAVVVRQMMNLSSSFDHRVVDGALAADFVQGLRACLEHPAMLFVEA